MGLFCVVEEGVFGIVKENDISQKINNYLQNLARRSEIIKMLKQGLLSLVNIGIFVNCIIIVKKHNINKGTR